MTWQLRFHSAYGQGASAAAANATEVSDRFAERVTELMREFQRKTLHVNRADPELHTRMLQLQSWFLVRPPRPPLPLPCRLRLRAARALSRSGAPCSIRRAWPRVATCHAAGSMPRYTHTLPTPCHVDVWTCVTLPPPCHAATWQEGLDRRVVQCREKISAVYDATLAAHIRQQPSSNGAMGAGDDGGEPQQRLAQSARAHICVCACVTV